MEEANTQNNPETATVVNFGVLFLHLKETEKTEKPIDDKIPNIKPSKDPLDVFPNAIIIIPSVAKPIEIQTFKLIVSFKKK